MYRIAYYSLDGMVGHANGCFLPPRGSARPFVMYPVRNVCKGGYTPKANHWGGGGFWYQHTLSKSQTIVTGRRVMVFFFLFSPPAFDHLCHALGHEKPFPRNFIYL